MDTNPTSSAAATAASTSMAPAGNFSAHDCEYKAVQFWISGIAGNILCFAGFVGNLLTLLLLTRMGTKTSVLVYITAVCISDAIILFFSSLFVLSPGAFG